MLYSQWADTFTRENAVEALAALDEAIKLAPGHMIIQAMLADVYVCSHQFSYGFVEQPLDKALALASEAVLISPECQLGYLAIAGVHALRNDRDKFVEAAQRVIDAGHLSNNNVAALAPYYAVLGMLDEARELGEKILALHLPRSGECRVALALCRYLRQEYKEALAQARKIEMPGSLWDGLLRLCAAGMLQEEAEARAAAAELLKAYPQFREQGGDILRRAFPKQDCLPLVCEGLAAGGPQIA